MLYFNRLLASIVRFHPGLDLWVCADIVEVLQHQSLAVEDIGGDPVQDALFEPTQQPPNGNVGNGHAFSHVES